MHILTFFSPFNINETTEFSVEVTERLAEKGLSKSEYKAMKASKTLAKFEIQVTKQAKSLFNFFTLTEPDVSIATNVRIIQSKTNTLISVNEATKGSEILFKFKWRIEKPATSYLESIFNLYTNQDDTKRKKAFQILNETASKIDQMNLTKHMIQLLDAVSIQRRNSTFKTSYKDSEALVKFKARVTKQETGFLESIINLYTNQDDSKMKVIQILEEITSKIEQFNLTENMIQLLEKIPIEERALTIEMACSLFNKTMDANEKEKVLDAVINLPFIERESVVKASLHLCIGQDYDTKIRMLESIKEFHRNERQAIVEAIKPFVPRYSANLIIYILNASKVGSINKALNILLFFSFLPTGKSHFNYINTLKENILPHEKELVIQMILDLCQNMLDEHKLEAISFIALFSAEEKKSILELMDDLCEGLTSPEKLKIIEAIYNIPTEIRVSLSKNQDEIILCKKLDINGKLNLLGFLKTCPFDTRKIIIQATQPLWLSNKEQITDIFRTLTFFPNYYIKDLCAFLQQCPIIDPFPQSISNLLQAQPDLQEGFYNHLMECLRSPDNYKVNQLASFILKHREILLIDDEDHPLIQAAEYAKDISEVSFEPQNPYKLYRWLQKEALQMTPAFNISVDLIENKPISWNLTVLQKCASKQSVVTYGELPQGVKIDSLINTFKDLEKRIENTSNPDEIQSYISSVSSTDFKTLQTNFTKDFYLNYLLQAQGDSSQAAPADVIRFRAIVKYILDQSNERKVGQILSNQEETLIKYSASIQECSIGKSEGIALAYQYLPMSYKYHKEQALFVSQEKGLDYLHQLLQTALNNAFCNEKMLQEMTETDQVITQLSHQSLFLKNRLGKYVGLQHPLTFDQYTYILYEKLIKKDFTQSLEIFFKHFKPQQLISILMTSFEKDKNSVHQLYGSLTSLFPEKIILNEMWDYDDETDQFHLTEKGALELWLASKILNQANK